MLRTVLAAVIAAHGIGHILFLVPLLGAADWGQSTRSWLLTGETPVRLVGIMIWIAVLVGFAAAAYGLWNQETWWRGAAVAASVISIAGLALFWASPATSPAVSALVFNVLLLGALLIAHWPSVEAVGA